MTDWEEKTCQLCTGLAGMFHRREHLVLQGEFDKADMLDEPIRVLIDDLRNWLLKNVGDKDE